VVGILRPQCSSWWRTAIPKLIITEITEQVEAEVHRSKPQEEGSTYLATSSSRWQVARERSRNSQPEDNAQIQSWQSNRLGSKMPDSKHRCWWNCLRNRITVFRIGLTVFRIAVFGIGLAIGMDSLSPNRTQSSSDTPDSSSSSSSSHFHICAWSERL
jgi:hypothetical protein